MSTPKKVTNETLIDRAIVAARNKAKAKASGDKVSKTERGSSIERPKLSAEEKAARTAEKAATKAAKKAERDRAREERRAAQEASKRTPHLAKVAKAASKLPALEDRASAIFNEVTTNFSRDQVTALAAHLQHFNRAQATQRALSQKVEAGMQVKIVGGDSRYVGLTGVVSKAQRIRCYVEVAGAKKPVYLFTSDVEIMSTRASAANG